MSHSQIYLHSPHFSRLLRPFTFFATLLFLSTATGRTVTDANKVVYDVVNETEMSVTVSATNNSIFNNLTTDIVIPAEVMNTASTAGYSDGPYHVVGMAHNAFANCPGITSVTVEAPITKVEYNTFQNCTGLTTVVLPSSVTTIGSYAFNNCSSLVTIGDISNVTQIEAYAFGSCTSLEEITLPSGLNNLGSRAFEKCTSLESVTIPSSLKTLPAHGFFGCTSLQSVTIDGETLTDIQNSCFQQCKSLEAPAFPPSLKTIGDRAFAECDNLGTLTLPSGITVDTNAFTKSGISQIVWPDSPLTLKGNVFSEIHTLKNLTLPSWMTTVTANLFTMATDLENVIFSQGVETIGDSAFKGCLKLTTVTFPKSLENIGQSAFLNCELLTDPTFPSSMTMISTDAFTGCKALRDIVLPAGASMGRTVFNNTTLSSVTFPKEPMGELSQQFLACQSEITSVVIPGWMTRIPDYTFYNWPKLSDVTISEGVEVIGVQAFNAPNAIESIILPSSVLVIEKEAFRNSKTLREVSFNDGLKTIGQNAFQECSGLTAVTIPSSVEVIESSAFRLCSGLKKVVFSEDGSATPPSAFHTIGIYAFSGCPQLTEVTLPSTIETIAERGFEGDAMLETINWPASLKSIGGYAFFNCGKLTSVSFNPGEGIGDCAFMGCRNISKIQFPDEPCSFGNYVFHYNDVFTTFSFPEWMTGVPNGFCANWSRLEKVEFHDGIESIGSGTFMGDGTLHDVTFPKNLRRIYDKAFSNCNHNVQLRDESGNWAKDENGNNVFEYFGEVVLPDGIEVDDEAFASSTVTKITFEGCAEFGEDCFKNLKNIREFGFPSCLTTIPEGFCNGWLNLTKVVLPEDCVEIGKEAFKGCSRLESMTYTGYTPGNDDAPAGYIFPPHIEKIGEGAFEGSSVAAINWPDHKIELGKSAFRNCYNLTSVVIPKWMDQLPEKCFEVDFPDNSKLVTVSWEDRTGEGAAQSITIGDYAFHNSGKLETFSFPETDVTLGKYAFHNCKSLKSIEWNNKGVNLGVGSFSSCGSLAELSIPDYVTEIPNECFRGTTSLPEVNLGRNVTLIGSNAFESSGIGDIVWPDNLTEIRQNGFSNTKLKDVVIPGTVATLGAYSFSGCSLLESAVISEGTVKIDDYAFQNCQALRRISLPSTLGYTSGNGICANNKALEEVLLAEGMIAIPWKGFINCTSLKSVVIPKSVTTVRDYAFCDTGLETVADYGENQTIGIYAFYNCKDLTTFHAYGRIDMVNPLGFQGCGNLKDFIYDSEEPIGDIKYNAFENCTSLRSFPRLYAGTLEQNAFKNCSSLRQFHLPVRGFFYNYLTGPVDYLNGATSLESIVFPYEGNKFKLRDKDIAGAPLRALSFSYARNIVRPYADKTAYTILPYTPDKTVDMPNRGVSKLIVPRGERWKYMEAGYGQLFDIVEMKDPQINIEGHIYSKFNAEEGKNHYTAYLRWEVPYSDLNPDDETTVTVFRNDKEIGDVVFGRPEVVEKVDGVACDHDIIRVKVTLNGEPGGFYGDFNYPVLDNDGKLKYYQRVYMSETEYMYFDAYTHRRLVNIDKYGYTSWFIMKDEFVSPDLKTPGVAVPDRYTYTARMNGYKYYTLENNDNLEEIDGLMYHKVWHDPDSIRSTAYVMRTAQATPAISFAGLYTTAEIMADTDHSLEPTIVHDRRPDRSYKIKLSLDPALMAQKGRDNDTSQEGDLVKGITIYNVAEDDTRTKLIDFTFPNRSGEYTFTIPANDYPGPGKRYQIDTYSYQDMLGTFGSAILSIPDAPTVQAHVETAPAPSLGHDHNGVRWNGTVSLSPVVDKTGYGDGGAAFTADSYRIGIWRSLDNVDTWDAGYYRLPSDGNSDLLLHHFGTQTEDGACSPCDQCDITPGLGHSADAITYNDLYDVDNTTAHKVEYRTRMYVKVPDKSLGNETMWMVAEDVQDAGGQVISGVGNVTVDGSPEEVRYFDLQGRPLASPVPGTPCLRVTPSSSGIIY